MNEYKIIENTPSVTTTEGILNQLAEEGWRVVSFGEFQICLERNDRNEIKTTEQICG